MRGAAALAALIVVACGSAGPAAGPLAQPSPSGRTASPAMAASPTPLPASDLAGAVGPAGGPGAATQLAARPRCAEAGSRTGVADLSWAPAATRGTEQRVALTIFAEGFDTGSFQVSPPLASDEGSFTWAGTNPGGAHRWRVLTRHGSIWTPSAIEIFTGETCVSDTA